jgi:tRNA(Ile)-lysidine synthase
MIERVRLIVDAYQLNKVDSKLLVGVSGGMDSMVLVDILMALQCNIHIAHMNYGLRGAESDADEAFVKQYAHDNGLVCHIVYADMKELGGESVQMAARSKRYNWFNKLIHANGYDYLLTAHHLNDSLETTLLNLAKGTGIKGLTGMSMKKGNLLRPLLTTKKGELLAYAEERKLKWREDATNAESKYQRNKIRNQVVPILEELNPALLDTFLSTKERLEGVNALLRKEVEVIRKQHLTIESKVVALDLSWYSASAMNDVLLSELLKPYGISFGIAKEIGRCQVSGAIFYSDEYQLNVDRGKLLISLKSTDSPNPIEISSNGIYSWGDWEIETEVETTAKIDHQSTDVLHVDLAKIDLPVLVRSWEEGDFFIPLGMSGKKKISDFMIDHKIPLTLKKGIPMFVSGQDIFWIGGYRMDDHYKITDQTKEVLKIKITRRD